MKVSYDPAKRTRVINERQLDLADAAELFDGFHLTRRDDAHSVDEDRMISVGMIADQVVIVIWTERPDSRRIVTMWKANDRERTAYFRQSEHSR